MPVLLNPSLFCSFLSLSCDDFDLVVKHWLGGKPSISFFFFFSLETKSLMVDGGISSCGCVGLSAELWKCFSHCSITLCGQYVSKLQPQERLNETGLWQSNCLRGAISRGNIFQVVFDLIMEMQADQPPHPFTKITAWPLLTSMNRSIC